MSRGPSERFGVPLPRRGSPSRAVTTAGADGGDHQVLGSEAIASAVVDCALYEDGNRRGGRLPLEEALESASCTEHGFAWIGLHDPNPTAMEAVGRHFELHPLAIEDAIHAHQRPKLEVHGDTLFVVLKTARYVDAEELVDIGELMVFVGPRFVVTVRHGEASPLGGVRAELEEHPHLLSIGPSAVLYAVIDRVVDDYGLVLEGLAVDVDQIEAEVFSGTVGRNPAERIYRLKREVLEFKRAVAPLVEPVRRLAADRVPPLDPRGGEYFRDVLDHLLRDAERVQNVDELLTSILNANMSQLTVRDNQDMRKISAWVAIAAVPTMVFGLYGMNFDHMPELGWRYGYPLVLVVTALVCAVLYRRFRHSGWL